MSVPENLPEDFRKVVWRGGLACVLGPEHDWRVDPRWLLASHPPQQRLICAECGTGATRAVPYAEPPPTDDPRGWPKALPSVADETSIREKVAADLEKEARDIEAQYGVHGPNGARSGLMLFAARIAREGLDAVYEG